MPPNTFTFLSEVFLLASYSGRPPATGRVARAGRGRPGFSTRNPQGRSLKKEAQSTGAAAGFTKPGNQNSPPNARAALAGRGSFLGGPRMRVNQGQREPFFLPRPTGGCEPSFQGSRQRPPERVRSY